MIKNYLSFSAKDCAYSPIDLSNSNINYNSVLNKSFFFIYCFLCLYCFTVLNKVVFLKYLLFTLYLMEIHFGVDNVWINLKANFLSDYLKIFGKYVTCNFSPSFKSLSKSFDVTDLSYSNMVKAKTFITLKRLSKYLYLLHFLPMKVFKSIKKLLLMF